MDLKQEVSLSALKRGKAPAYPVKTSINLVDTQQQRGNLLAQLGLFAIALVLIGVFAKFAVVDPLAASAASSNEVSAAQARLDVLAAENADYAELLLSVQLSPPLCPAFLVLLPGPSNGQRVRRHILGNGGARRDIGPLAHRHRCHQIGVAADEGAVPDGAAVLLHAVVVGGDGAAAEV